MNEEWKDIPNWPYGVSNHGQVRNRKGRLLKPTTNSKGNYPTVALRRRGERRSVKVHVLVATAFIGPRPNGHETNHKDGNKQNNHISNLEYLTSKEHHEHTRLSGLLATGPRNGNYTKPESIPRGSRRAHAKLSEADIPKIRQRVRSGHTFTSIGKAFDIDRCVVSRIVFKKAWNHVVDGEDVL